MLAWRRILDIRIFIVLQLKKCGNKFANRCMTVWLISTRQEKVTFELLFLVTRNYLNVVAEESFATLLHSIICNALRQESCMPILFLKINL